MKEIKLTKGYVTIVDDDVYEWASKFKWYVQLYKNGAYAVRKLNSKQSRLHREIIKAKNNQIVDHINQNGLDNRRSNLRFANKKQNAFNSKIYSNNKSGFKGVSWHSRDKKWAVSISYNKKRIALGYYENLKDAVCAYRKASVIYYGEFANVNNNEEVI